ncbi:MAG TPA: inositol monophosphatase family protein, partial [Chryseosolibacter sp.]|nr:inositol monophosphatase family protein [Chryseosolibacter sp.]
MTDDQLVRMLIEAGKAVQKKVYESLRTSGVEQLSAVHAEKKEDTIYQIDREVEDVLLPVLTKYAVSAEGFVILAEGIGDGENGTLLPVTSSTPKFRIIIDPIDGTRGIMYNKRPAFFLAGIAVNNGIATRLSDIFISVMVELPTTKHFLADVLWAIRGRGAYRRADNLLTGESTPQKISPSRAKTIIGGFAQFARFFPPGRDILSAIEDELIHTIQPDNPGGKALVFEDQYICTGGQLYEMLMGHDRFIADIRGILYRKLAKEGTQPGHVCHPYDACTFLIGKEAGIIITDGYGNDFDGPLDLNSEVNWIGYANSDIRGQVEPIL